MTRGGFAGILLVGLLAAAIVAGIGIWHIYIMPHPSSSLQPVAITNTTTRDSSVYRNTRYRYQLTIPSGWRVSTDLMRAVQPPSFVAAYAPETSDILIITDMDPASESNLAREAEAITSQGKLVTINNTTTSSKIITLSVSEFDLVPIESFRTSTVGSPPVPGLMRDVQSVDLQDGVTGETYRILSIDGTVDWFTVDISYHGRAKDGWGGEVRSLNIKTRIDKDFSEGNISTLYQTFRYW